MSAEGDLTEGEATRSGIQAAADTALGARLCGTAASSRPTPSRVLSGRTQGLSCPELGTVCHTQFLLSYLDMEPSGAPVMPGLDELSSCGP